MSTRVNVNPSDAWTVDSGALATTDGNKQLVGKDPFRGSVTIINDPDSAGQLYLRPDSSTTGGVRVKPGASLTLNTIAAVLGYASGGAVTWYAVSETGYC